MRAVIVDSGGIILKTISSPPELFILQAGMGETTLALTTDDGAYIDDANIIVSDDGEFAVKPGAPMGTTAPGFSLELVA